MAFTQKTAITWIALVEKQGLDTVLHNMVSFAFKLTSNDLQGRYKSLQFSLSELHDDLKEAKLKNELKAIEQLAETANALDTECGVDDEPSPNDPPEVTEDIVKRLDADREKFKTLLREGFEKNKSQGAREFLIAWAKLIFDTNGYVAPMRRTKAEAERDAAGLTDLFAELLEEIEQKTPAPQPPPTSRVRLSWVYPAADKGPANQVPATKEARVFEVTAPVRVPAKQ